jgi:hypothetical protein
MLLAVPMAAGGAQWIQPKVAQMVEALNRLTARDAFCLLVDCRVTVLDKAPSDEERQQSLDGCTKATFGTTVLDASIRSQQHRTE